MDRVNDIYQNSVSTRGSAGFLARVEFRVALGVVFFSTMNFLRLPQFYFTFSDFLTCTSLILLVGAGRLSLRPIGAAPTIMWMGGLTTMLAGLSLSSLVYGDSMRGLVYLGQYSFAYLLLLVVIGGRSEKQTVALAKAYVLSVVLMCIHGIYVINILGHTDTTFVSGSGRLMGFVERENECAAVIALAVPILLFLCASGKLTKFAMLALPIMGYGVMLTGSNTGLASFAFGVGAFALFTLDLKRFLPTIAIGIGTAAAISHWGRDYLPAAFQRRVLGALETGDIGQAGTFDSRLALIREAINRADSSIFLGVGADQYQYSSFLGAPVHNLYLLLWTEGGLITMIGFITMILAGLGPGLAAMNRPGGRLYTVCTCTTVVLFLLCINAFASVYGRFWSVPVIIAVALSQSFVSSQLKNRPSASGRL